MNVYYYGAYSRLRLALSFGSCTLRIVKCLEYERSVHLSKTHRPCGSLSLTLIKTIAFHDFSSRIDPSSSLSSSIDVTVCRHICRTISNARPSRCTGAVIGTSNGSVLRARHMLGHQESYFLLKRVPSAAVNIIMIFYLFPST